MPPTPPSLPGLPPLTWHGEPDAVEHDEERGRLSITARAGTDWFNDPLGGAVQLSAPALLLTPPEGDFGLSARVHVAFADTFDAAVLVLHQDERHYAKLCFERSPQGRATIVSVVTRGTSDDANSVVVDGDEVHLRVVRTGPAYAFHHSTDGTTWHLVRVFRLDEADGAPVRAGLLAQAPGATPCTSTFSDVVLSTTVPADLRDGS